MCGTVALFVLCLAVCYASADSQPPKKPLVLVAVGTRADVLKLSSTINWLRTYYTDLLDLQVLFSGQDSTETLLAEINVQPDYDLKLGEYASNDANIFLPKVMEAVIGVLRDSRPSAVVIRGDTTTAIAAAMAAFYCKMPLIHIDAGVRSWDMSSPHPEEFNRRAISLIATLSLVPTEYSKLNLLKDGMYPDTIVVTGSTSVDSVAEAIKPLNDEDAARLSDVVSVLSIGDSSFRKKKYVVVSIKSSSDSLIEEVARAVDKLCQRFTEFTFFVIWNKGATADDTQRENVVILSPMRHAPFLRLLQNSTIVITDSASVQLEASVFAVPSFILA